MVHNNQYQASNILIICMKLSNEATPTRGSNRKIRQNASTANNTSRTKAPDRAPVFDETQHLVHYYRNNAFLPPQTSSATACYYCRTDGICMFIYMANRLLLRACCISPDTCPHWSRCTRRFLSPPIAPQRHCRGFLWTPVRGRGRLDRICFKLENGKKYRLMSD